MKPYFTRRVSLQKLSKYPRSSHLSVRKGLPFPSKTTEAGSGRDEKVHITANLAVHVVSPWCTGGHVRAVVRLPGGVREGIYPGVYHPAIPGRHIPGHVMKA